MQLIVTLFTIYPVILVVFLVWHFFRQRTGIYTYIIRRNKYVHTKRVAERYESFDQDEGTYLIDSRAVNLKADLDTGLVDPRPELIYLEGDPKPITLGELEAVKGEFSYLDRTLIKTALKDVSGIRSLGIGKLIKGIGGINPASFLLIVFALIILLSFLQGGI